MEDGVLFSLLLSSFCTAGLTSFTSAVISVAFFWFWHSKITTIAFIILLGEPGLTGAVFGIQLRETIVHEHNAGAANYCTRL